MKACQEKILKCSDILVYYTTRAGVCQCKKIPCPKIGQGIVFAEV